MILTILLKRCLARLKKQTRRVENHMSMAYSDVLIPPMNGLPIAQVPEVSGVKLREIREIIRKSCAGRATRINGVSFKLYYNCSKVLKHFTIRQPAWKQVVVQECHLDTYWKECKFHCKFPIHLPVSGNIFRALCSRMTDLLIGNHYINTSVFF